VLSRLVGAKLEKKFGKPVIIENRPAGGGIPAALAVVRGPADGYTLISATSTLLSFNVTVRKSMPYDPRNDILPLAMTVRTPFMLVVNPSLPVHSVDDLVRLARQKPLTFGAPGSATIHRLMAETFKTMFKLDATYVPYKGSVPALTDLVGGHIHFMFADLPPARELEQSGKLRALGVTTAARVPVVPDLRPLSEVGMPGFDMASWHTIAIRAGVPRDIMEKLAAAIRDGMADPEVVKILEREGAIPVKSPGLDELKRFVDGETMRWAKVIEAAGLAGSE
jgi:tripartite-type tricarboxylate transporter receptor subunit TctC